MIEETTLGYMVGAKLGRLDARMRRAEKDFTSPSDKGRSIGFIHGYKVGYHREMNQRSMRQAQPPKVLTNARCHVCGGQEGMCKCLT